MKNTDYTTKTNYTVKDVVKHVSVSGWESEINRNGSVMWYVPNKYGQIRTVIFGTPDLDQVGSVFWMVTDYINEVDLHQGYTEKDNLANYKTELLRLIFLIYEKSAPI